MKKILISLLWFFAGIFLSFVGIVVYEETWMAYVGGAIVGSGICFISNSVRRI